MSTTKKILKDKEKTSLKNTKKSIKKVSNSSSQKLLKTTKKISPKNKNKYKEYSNSKKENVNYKSKDKVNKSIQRGGSDICSKDLNKLLAGNPMVLMGDKGDVDFSKEMSAAGQSFSKDVMSSFGGIEKGWGGSPGMPPKFPSGCVLM